MLLTCLLRGSRLTMATDLSTLAADMRATSVHYFLNVPVLLERMRSGVEQQISKTGGLVGMIYDRAKAAWYRRDRGERAALDSLWLAIARAVIFPTIRKKMIGVSLRSLICGSAPLAVKSGARLSEKESRQILQFLLYDEENRKWKTPQSFYPMAAK